MTSLLVRVRKKPSFRLHSNTLYCICRDLKSLAWWRKLSGMINAAARRRFASW